MKAVIMAGGEGTRLRPLTSNAPKPLLPLLNRPMMEHIVGLLVRHGFDDIVVTLAFLPQSIRAYFGDGSEFGVRMVYATEESPLGTAGSVGNAREVLAEPFLVISGDVLTDIDLSALVEFHSSHEAVATLALKSVPNPLEFGIVIASPEGMVERFLEKPTWGEVFSDTVNTGIYVCDPRVFDHIPPGERCDFSSDVFPSVMASGGRVCGYVAEGYWEDVGTLDAYLRAHRDALDGAVALDIPGMRVDRQVWMGEGAEVDPAAQVDGPAMLGDHCRVQAGARIGPYAVVGANVSVGSGVLIERSVVCDSTYLGDSVRLRGSIVGPSCDLRDHARCEEGTVLGDHCFVGDHAVVNPGVRVYPYKTVEPGAIVNSSIVWESRGARSLFSAGGVTGLANVDVTPEMACRVAMAYASSLKKGATVTTSRDSSRAARALKRAVMAGLNAAGVNVDDLAMASVPLTRFHIGTRRAQGGLTVRLCPGDPQSVAIRFFDADGIDMDEVGQRRIERSFNRGDFRRVFAADIGEIDFPARALDYYTAALIDTVDVEEIRAQAFTVVVDYAFGSTAMIMPTLLGKLGADVLAINPYAYTAGAAAFDAGVHAARVADLVRASDSTMGAVLDPGGERITLIDETGHILTTDQALLALVAMSAAAYPKCHVALPVSVTAMAERVAEAAGGRVSRTRIGPAHIMEACRQSDVVLGADGAGGFIVGDFLPAFDAVATFVHVLGLLASTGGALSEVVAGLPQVHQAREEVATPWRDKGLLMRLLLERTAGAQTSLIDGIRIGNRESWALIRTDPDHPVTTVWAEGPTEAEARAKVTEWSRILRQVLRTGDH
ncbi:MAG: sugar phosphate nucleotidyltransferase [Acidimicrobiales bacterium]